MDSPKWRCGRIGRTNVFDEPPTLSGDIRERYEYDVYGGCIVHTDAGQDGQWMTGDDTTDTESGVGNPYMFTGRRYDPEAGLYYYRARYYSPEIGRFLQPDPIGYIAGLNLYAYVNNGPVTRKDPLGLFYDPVEDDLMDGLIDAFQPPCCRIWSPPMYQLLGYESAWRCANGIYRDAWRPVGGAGTGIAIGGGGMLIRRIGLGVVGEGAWAGMAAQWLTAYAWCQTRECLDWGTVGPCGCEK